MSAVYVDSIKDKSNTKTLATLSSSAVTIGSDVTFPAGHVIKQTFIGDEVNGVNVSTTSSSYTDISIEIEHVTAMSSTDSYLVAEFYSSMANVNSATVTVDILMTGTTSTTYAGDESLLSGSYPNEVNWAGAGDVYWPLFIRNYCGLVSEMGMPDTKSSWAAGDSLFFRVWIKTSANTFKLCHQNAGWNFTITEVVR